MLIRTQKVMWIQMITNLVFNNWLKQSNNRRCQAGWSIIIGWMSITFLKNQCYLSRFPILWQNSWLKWFCKQYWQRCTYLLGCLFQSKWLMANPRDLVTCWGWHLGNSFLCTILGNIFTVCKVGTGWSRGKDGITDKFLWVNVLVKNWFGMYFCFFFIIYICNMPFLSTALWYNKHNKSKNHTSIPFITWFCRN